MNAALSAGTISGFRSDTVTVDGIRLHYWVGGQPDGPPVILWHGFLSTGYAWREVAPALASAGLSVLVPDMRGYGDSDKPDGDDGYDARALAEECRSLVAKIRFGNNRPIILVARDMGALPELIWAADHAHEIAGLLYIEAPVMLSAILRKVCDYGPEAMAHGSMWWWILPLAPGVAERLIVGNDMRGLFSAGSLRAIMSSTMRPSRPAWFMNICGHSPDAKACLAAWEFTAPPSSTSTRPSR
jgi:pimeloyl-ACP methyl ester carboxylesterase